MPNHVKSKIEFDCSREKMEEIFNKFNTHYEAKEGYTYNGNLRFKEKNKNHSYGFLDLKTGLFSRREQETVKGVPENYIVDIAPAFDHFPDFNKIKPQPDNIFSGNLSQQDKEDCKKNGIPNWYDWNCENWGTKWNSYDLEKLSWNSYKFETAWSGVPGLILKISEIFPDVKINYTYADEDSGSNTGIYEFLNGEVVSEEIPDSGSHRGYEVYLSLNPDCDYIKLIDGVYQYVDEDEEE